MLTRVPKNMATALAVARKLEWPMEEEGECFVVAVPRDWVEQVIDLGGTRLVKTLPVFHRGLEGKGG